MAFVCVMFKSQKFLIWIENRNECECELKLHAIHPLKPINGNNYSHD